MSVGKTNPTKRSCHRLLIIRIQKNGVIQGGFDRANLFQQVEQGFDRLFGYDRQQSESFDYHNTIKNGSNSEQLELQSQSFSKEKKKAVFQSSEKENNMSCNLDSKVADKQSNNQQNNSGSDSLLSIVSLGNGNNYDTTLTEELHTQKRKKKKRKDANYRDILKQSPQ